MNKRYRTIRITLLCIMLCSCSPSYIMTAWKNQHALPGKYKKILVAGMINEQGTNLRGQIEQHFTDGLKKLGYHAVSYLAEFGNGTLVSLQQDTYIMLANKGIDAVLTIALVDADQQGLPELRIAYKYPARYYDQRTAYYKQMQSPLKTGNYIHEAGYLWEMILFDLSTLQPNYISRTQPDTGRIEKSLNHEFWKTMISKMVKEKFLKKQTAASGRQSF